MAESSDPVVHDLSPPIDEFREIARQATMAHFVNVALRDQRPDTQRAMDVVKASEARLMLTNPDYVSSLLQSEASIRSKYTGFPISAMDQARAVDAEAKKLHQIELARVEAAVAIDAAGSVAEIAAILARLQIAIPVRTPGQTLPV